MTWSTEIEVAFAADARVEQSVKTWGSCMLSKSATFNVNNNPKASA
jgi:hypothetical protein